MPKVILTKDALAALRLWSGRKIDPTLVKVLVSNDMEIDLPEDQIKLIQSKSKPGESLSDTLVREVQSIGKRNKYEDTSVIDMMRVAVEDIKHFQSPVVGEEEACARLLKPVLFSTPYFEVGNEVMEAAVTLGTDHPDILSTMLSRCRPPFPRTIVEWDAHHIIHYLGQVPSVHAPRRVAALIEQEPDSDAFYVSIMGVDSLQGKHWVGGLSPVSFRFSPDIALTSHASTVHSLLRADYSLPSTNIGNDDSWYREALKEWRERIYSDVMEAGCPVSILDRPGLDHAFMIPMTMGYMKRSDDKSYWESIAELSQHTSLELCHPFHRRMEKALQDKTMTRWQAAGWTGTSDRFHTTKAAQLAWNIFKSGIQEGMGLGRKVLGILALLNAKDREVHWGEPYTPSGSLNTGRRIIPYFARRKLTLLLPRTQVIRRMLKIAKQERAARRRHAVMGHWCSSKRHGNPSCEHEHENTNPRLKTCKHCGHLVWWRDAHERGDAGRGYVLKDFALHKRPKTGQSPETPPLWGILQAVDDVADKVVGDAMDEISKWPKKGEDQ